MPEVFCGPITQKKSSTCPPSLNAKVRINGPLFTLTLIPYPIKCLNFWFFLGGGKQGYKNPVDKGVFRTFKTGGFWPAGWQTENFGFFFFPLQYIAGRQIGDQAGSRTRQKAFSMLSPIFPKENKMNRCPGRTMKCYEEEEYEYDSRDSGTFSFTGWQLQSGSKGNLLEVCVRIITQRSRARSNPVWFNGNKAMIR